MELDDFLEEVPEQGQRRARIQRPEPPEGSFEEVLREAERMERSERAKDAWRRHSPTVREIGKGPEIDTRPKCHFCGDHRRLSPEVVEVGSKRVRLCRFCLRCYESDRAKRCLACGEPSSRRMLEGLCLKCRADGGKALVNLITLVRRRWVGVIKGDG